MTPDVKKIVSKIKAKTVEYNKASLIKKKTASK
jgi:hypothetical protein